MLEPAPNQAYVPYQFTSNEQIGPRRMWFRFHTVSHSVLNQVRQLSTSASDLQQEVTELRIEAAALSEQLALIKSQVLLGEAIIVLDNIVADYVFGPYGSQGRPRGRLSITHIDDMEMSHELGHECLDRWKRITILWARHHWTVSDVKTVGWTLRDIRFQPAHRPDDISDVSAVTIASYVPACCHHLGLTDPQLSCVVQDIYSFIDLLKTEFTSNDHVLVQAHDLFDRLNALNL